MIIKNEELIEKPLVSIVMPLYNSEKYIESTLKSILNQTYKNFELIIIDDGSKDSGSDIIKEYLKSDSRIKYYRNKKNSGVSFSRNRGIELSEGKWIAFIDSDDKWENSKLETQINYANNSGAEFLFTGSAFIDERDNLYPGIYSVPTKVNYKSLLKCNYISCSSVLIKKKYLEVNKFGRDDIHEDYACWLRILKQENISAYGISKPLLLYRVSRNSKSGNKIKSAKMLYGTYRYLGLNTIKSMYFWICFLLNRSKKYRMMMDIK